jgi:hypothetical protein
MRLRICRQPTGTVDGIVLEHFRQGLVYDIGSSETSPSRDPRGRASTLPHQLHTGVARRALSMSSTGAPLPLIGGSCRWIPRRLACVGMAIFPLHIKRTHFPSSTPRTVDHSAVQRGCAAVRRVTSRSRISRPSASGRHGFRRKRSQPASLACSRVEPPASPVSTMMPASLVRRSSRSRRVSSRPEAPGRVMSVTITSGRRAQARAKASSALSALTGSKPCVRRAMAYISIESGWSSTSRTTGGVPGTVALLSDPTSRQSRYRACGPRDCRLDDPSGSFRGRGDRSGPSRSCSTRRTPLPTSSGRES